MRSTLFYLPHSFAGLPVFGLGWCLILLVIAAIIRGLMVAKDPVQKKQFVDSLPVWGFAAFLIFFLVPNIETRLPDGTPIGVPIRGYGVMLLSAVLTGVGLAIHRAKGENISPDTILSLAFWIFVGGIFGARLFHVVQYWEDFQRPTLQATIWKILQFTEGGLVVFGSFVGAMIALFLFCKLRKLSFFGLSDVILPSFLVGQSLGRIGCFLNGCCFGGICEQPLPAVSFPQGSLPFIQHLEQGELLGLRLAALDASAVPSDRSDRVAGETRSTTRIVSAVRAGSWGEQQQIVPGDRIDELTLFREKSDNPVNDLNYPKFGVRLLLERIGQRTTTPAPQQRIETLAYLIPPEEIAQHSLPVHPAQLYSAIDAMLLAIFLWFLYPLIRVQGAILGLALLCHGTSRFLLEWIRSDEAAQFGTGLTISQLISVGMFAAGLAILIYAGTCRPKRQIALAGNA